MSLHAGRLVIIAGSFLALTGVCLGQNPYGRPVGPCQTPNYNVCRGFCKSQSAYRPPVVHGGVPFGYYETQWSSWPGHQTIKPFPAPAADAPAKPEKTLEVEPLPAAPRPVQSMRMPLESSNEYLKLPIVNPAEYSPR